MTTAKGSDPNAPRQRRDPLPKTFVELLGYLAQRVFNLFEDAVGSWTKVGQVALLLLVTMAPVALATSVVRINPAVLTEKQTVETVAVGAGLTVMAAVVKWLRNRSRRRTVNRRVPSIPAQKGQAIIGEVPGSNAERGDGRPLRKDPEPM